MSNGKLLEAFQKAIEGEATIPESVSNRMLFAGIVQLWEKVDAFAASFREYQENAARDKKALEERIKCLENAEEVDKERNVTFPGLWRDFGLPLFNLVIAIIITLILARAGLIL